MSATTFTDDFDSICDRLNHWFELKLLPYQPQDREYIAQFILSMVATMGNDFVHDQPFAQQDNISPALLCCILQATKNYLSDSSLNQLRLRFETQLEQLSPNEPARHFVEFILEQTH